MKPNWILIFLGGLSVVPSMAGVFPHYSLAEGDQDARLHIDNRASFLAVGDVDGDGYPDAIFSTKGDSAIRPRLALIRGDGHRWPRSSSVTELTTTRIVLNPSEEFLGMVDLNHDSRQDLVIWGPSALRIIWGTPDWPQERDLSVSGATLTVELGSSPFLSWKGMTVGDVNGDGVSDLIFQSIPYSVTTVEMLTHVVFGRSDFPVSVDSQNPAYMQTWAPYPGMNYFGMGSLVRDMNLDGTDDFIVGVANGISIVLGSSAPVAGFDVASSTPAVRLTRSQDSDYLSPAFFVDRTGKGRKDLVIQEHTPTVSRWFMVDPAALAVTTGTVALSSLSPGLLLQASNVHGSESIVAMGDFDGDGKEDLVSMMAHGSENYVFNFYLNGGDGPLPSEENFSILTALDSGFDPLSSLMADWDGDSKLDWFVWGGPPDNVVVQTLDVVYGFRPLQHPRIRVAEGGGASKRATLDLSVEGDPAEMKLGGAIEDDIKDKWIPYEQRRRVSLTSASGEKSVTAVFRITTGRESAPISTQVNMSEDGPPVAPITNRLKGASGVVEVDCRVKGGRLRATVYERGGRRVRTVADEEGAGVMTVRWDGRNEAGERVRPGVYVMALDFDGRTEKTEVLLEP